jgi:hypothetical protein
MLRFCRIGTLLFICVLSGSAYLAAPSPAAKTAKGVVFRRISGCDYFMVATKSDYDVLEWFHGRDPDKGDVLVGGFESYGFHDIYDETTDTNLRVWTEDYDLTKEDALDKLTEECE